MKEAGLGGLDLKWCGRRNGLNGGTVWDSEQMSTPMYLMETRLTGAVGECIRTMGSFGYISWVQSAQGFVLILFCCQNKVPQIQQLKQHKGSTLQSCRSEVQGSTGFSALSS